MKIIIFENMQHFCPTGFGWLQGFANTDIQCKLYDQQRSSLDDIYENEKDINVLVCFDLPTDEKTLHKLENIKKANNGCIIASVVLNYNKQLKKFKGVIDLFISHVFSHKYEKMQFNNNGLKLYFIPLGGHKTFFRPLYLEKTADLSFVGTIVHGERDEDKYLYSLLNSNKYSYYVFGMKLNNHDKIKYVQYRSLNTIYNRTRINLNFHYQFQKTENFKNKQIGRIELNGRTFDIALSGGFQICDHPLAKELFNDNIVVPDPKEWENIIDYYLNNEELMREKAYNSMQIALKEHTWEVRMRSFLNIIKTIKDKDV